MQLRHRQLDTSERGHGAADAGDHSMLLSLVVFIVAQANAETSRRLFAWWLPAAVAAVLVLSVGVLYMRPPPFGRPSRFRWTGGTTVLLAMLAFVFGGWVAERRLAERLDRLGSAAMESRADAGARSAGAVAAGSGQREVFAFTKVVAGGLGAVAIACLVLFGLEARHGDVRVETHWGGLGGGAGGWRLSPALLYLFLAVVMASMLTVIATGAISRADAGTTPAASATSAP